VGKALSIFFLESVHFGFLGKLFGLLEHLSSKLDKNDVGEQRSDQLRLAKQREVKIRDDRVNLAQCAQGAQVTQAS
jgi:hypothetical protein